jgi:thioredoxin reductase (NADPH)
MEQCHQQAIACGATIEYDIISRCFRHENAVMCVGDSCVYRCRTLIIATGASTKWLGLPSETYYRGYGVSSCATCDGRFFKGKKVAVVGGGNTAVEEALFLSQHAASVLVIHRRQQFRADQVLQDRLMAIPHVSVLWDHQLVQVLGHEGQATHGGRSVTGIEVQHVATHERTSYAMDGVFVAIGHTPNSGPFGELVEVDAEGYIQVTPGSTSTAIPGVFVAGDVQDHVYRQAITAAGQGCMAAMEAERFLQAQSA